ncbi:MAG TPA: hypothetical protein VKA35_08040 [Solirubrobacterales bacterium]|nr:hypothetical protein [Solirubrobacterales bacterium]
MKAKELVFVAKVEESQGFRCLGQEVSGRGAWFSIGRKLGSPLCDLIERGRAVLGGEGSKLLPRSLTFFGQAPCPHGVGGAIVVALGLAVRGSPVFLADPLQSSLKLRVGSALGDVPLDCLPKCVGIGYAVQSREGQAVTFSESAV